MRRVKRLFVVLGLAAVVACKGGDAGKPSAAEVHWADAGGATVTVGAAAAALPKDDLADGATPSIVQDDSGKRFAYTTRAGDVRILYQVGDVLGVGPKIAAPLDFKRAPDVEGALGAMLENAGPNRKRLATAVKATLGDKGLDRMLADGVAVPSPDWDDAYAMLGEPGKAQLPGMLLPLLAKGQPTAGLRHVVGVVPLHDAAHLTAMDERVRELVAKGEEPAAAAVLLRAIAVLSRPRAAQVGCDVLKKTKPDEGHVANEQLAEAATLAIAASVLAGGNVECKDDVARVLADPCTPWVRCAKGAPLTGHESSEQDEPLCTKEELAPVVAQELARSPADALEAKSGTRKELFAYAALVGAKALPDAFVQAHERRRYAITQPKEPPCDSGLPAGTACHCSEADLRDHACRGPSAHTGICKSEIDDKAKTIAKVVTATGP